MEPLFFSRTKSNSSFPSGKQAPESSFFTKVRDVFFAIANKIVRQTKKNETESSLKGRVEQKKMAVSMEQYALLIDEIKQLEQVKNRFLKQEGKSSLGFIKRYIEPCLFRLRKVKDIFKKAHNRAESVFVTEDVLAQIVSLKNGVALQRVKRELMDCVRKAIYDDLAYIANYQEESMSQASSSPQISTIVSLLLDLLKSVPEGGDLFSLYRWKHSVDVLRQGFVSLAVLLINKQKEEKAEEIQEAEQEIHQITDMLRNLLSEKDSLAQQSYSSFTMTDHPLLLLDKEESLSLRKNIEFFLSRFF